MDEEKDFNKEKEMNLGKRKKSISKKQYRRIMLYSVSQHILKEVKALERIITVGTTLIEIAEGFGVNKKHFKLFLSSLIDAFITYEKAIIDENTDEKDKE